MLLEIMAEMRSSSLMKLPTLQVNIRAFQMIAKGNHHQKQNHTGEITRFLHMILLHKILHVMENKLHLPAL